MNSDPAEKNPRTRIAKIGVASHREHRPAQKPSAQQPFPISSDTAAAAFELVEAYRKNISGRVLLTGDALAWKALPTSFYRHPLAQETLRVPAINTPYLVWFASGRAIFEEREPDGAWCATEVGAGTFFLTVGGGAYELRWRSTGATSEPLEALHIFLPMVAVNRAIREVHGSHATKNILLRDASGVASAPLAGLMQMAHSELVRGPRAAGTVVSNLAQLLAVYLAREFAVMDDSRLIDGGEMRAGVASALPGFKLKRCLEHMAANLAEPLRLETLARSAGMSEFHFSRLFKRATGVSPGRRLLDMRMEQARRLLRESDASMIRIGMETGFSTPSHFAYIFRRENGCSPREYRREQ